MGKPVGPLLAKPIIRTHMMRILANRLQKTKNALLVTLLEKKNFLLTAYKDTMMMIVDDNGNEKGN